MPTTTTVDVQELPARFGELLSLAAGGAEVIVTDGATPKARLVPLEAAPAPARLAGLHPGAIRTAHDFDAPLPDDFWTGPP